MLHLLIAIAAVALLNAALPSLLIAALAAACLCARSWSAATRYAICWLALCLIVVLPFVSGGERQASSRPVQIHIVHVAKVTPLPLPPAAHLASSFSAFDVIAMVCCGLILVRLAQLLYGFAGVLRLKRGVSLVFPGSLPQTGTRRSFLLATSDQVSSPVAVGYWRPMIILPKHLISNLQADELEHVIAHEMAHLERFDDWSIAAQRFIAALFAFHPLVQFLSWRLSVEREIACDDRVIAGSKPKSYATSLTAVAEWVRFGSTAPLMLPLFERKSNLARRIENVLDSSRSHAPRLSLSRALSFAVVCLAIAFAAVRVPALIASPLSDPAPNDLGPIVVTLSDGSTTTYTHNGADVRSDSAFPAGTIVFKRHGKSYIIRDKAILDQSADLIRPARELSKQQEELAEKQSLLGEQQEKLGDRMSLLADSQLDQKTRQMIEHKVQEAVKELQSADMRKALQSAQRAQERIAGLQSQLGDLQAHLGEELSKSGDAQGKLGEEQGKLGEEQGRLGELQGKLGEQQAADANRIQRELNRLIERAEKQGLAKPLD